MTKPDGSVCSDFMVENSGDNETRQGALLTKHEKLTLISEHLADVGISVQETSAFDTDNLGTFSGEVPRSLSPLECAKRKAKLACELTGLDIGLGSEGSFGGGPMPGFVNWDEEILVMYDKQTDFEIVAYVQGPIKVGDFTPLSIEQLRNQLKKFDANQGWMVSTDTLLAKGLQCFEQVLEVLDSHGLADDEILSRRKVRVSPDFRAMMCPERQDYIRQAAKQLKQRIAAQCPICGTSDFWRVEAVSGAICSACGVPSEHPKAFIKRCRECNHEVQEDSDTPYIDPGKCQICNP